MKYTTFKTKFELHGDSTMLGASIQLNNLKYFCWPRWASQSRWGWRKEVKICIKSKIKVSNADNLTQRFGNFHSFAFIIDFVVQNIKIKNRVPSTKPPNMIYEVFTCVAQAPHDNKFGHGESVLGMYDFWCILLMTYLVNFFSVL